MLPVKAISFHGFFMLLTYMAILYTPVNLEAQEPVFRHYSTKDGLPSSETYCAVQDHRGYMYFGTDRGLARYDGYNFEIFSTSKGNLPDNTIFGLYKDIQNRIWYQSFSGNAGYFYKDSFYIYPYNHLIHEASPERKEGIGIDLDGGFMGILQNYLGDQTAFRIDNNGHLHKNLQAADPHTRDIFLTQFNTCLTIGQITATQARVISQKSGEVLCTFPVESTNSQQAFAGFKKNKDLLLYTSGVVFLIRHGVAKPIIRCNGHILSMQVDKDDNLWIGYIDKGVEFYKAADGYKNPQNMLLKHSISGMAKDKEGGMWFTTLEDGIFYLPPDFIYSYNIENGQTVSKVMKIEQAGDQLLFVLSNLDLAYKHKEDSSIRISRNTKKGILDIASGPDQTMYYAALYDLELPIASKYIRCPAQKLYIGPYHVWGYIGSTLFKLKPGTREYEYISLKKIAKITCILETGPDELLIATLNGLYKFNAGKTSSLQSLHPLFSQRISGILPLDGRHLVFTTIGNGVLVTDTGNFAHPIHYAEEDGLPSNMCNMLIRDNDSTIIVGGNKGICRISCIMHPERVVFRTADINNGLASNEVNDIKLLGKNLWIATASGVSVMPLRLLTAQPKILFLNIEQVKVNNEPVNTLLPGRFEHDRNNLHFSFTGINFQHASTLLYKYRLSGSDRRWNQSSERSVIYNALPPGDYTFEVLIASAGIQNPKGITYTFSILPPFYNTWWFRTLMAIFLISLTYLLVARRISTIRRQALIQNDLNIFRDRALRSQMNPHFIYNSMNAIQNFIKKNDTDTSIDYLALFSRLMRTTFNNSGETEISLDKDLEAVTMYAEIENMRFSGRFKLHISYDAGLAPSKIMLPPFLIQPFIENAILHGFATTSGTGNIWINIALESRGIKISVKDDGAGRDKMLEIGRRKQAYLSGETRNSSGITVTLKRIRQVWGKNFSEDFFRITDLYSAQKIPCGTLVEFYLPL
jgi:ligand-binding sensor domain-containing protein